MVTLPGRPDGGGLPADLQRTIPVSPLISERPDFQPAEPTNRPFSAR